MKDKRKTLTIIKFILLLFIIIGVPALLYITQRDTLFNAAWLKQLPQMLRQYKWRASLILILLQTLQVIISIIPGQPIQFAASYLFSIIPGYLISITGAVIGAFIAFHLAGILGRDMLEMIFGEDKITYYQGKLNSGKGLTAVLLIYLIPGVPKDLVAYAAGISGMRVRPFLLVSTLGRSPAMIGSLLFGHFFSIGNYKAIAALAVLTVIILLACVIKRKALVGLLDDLGSKDEDIEEVIDGAIDELSSVAEAESVSESPEM